MHLPPALETPAEPEIALSNLARAGTMTTTPPQPIYLGTRLSRLIRVEEAAAATMRIRFYAPVEAAI